MRRTVMTHSMQTFRMRSLVTFVTAMVIFAGCKEEITGPDNTEDAPDLPPISVFQMDFGDFSATKPIVGKAQDGHAIPRISAGGNWTFAALNVGLWKTLITLGMVVPVAAFGEAFNHQAEHQGDGSWVRSYSFTPPLGVRHTAALRAIVSVTGIQWEMRISKEGAFTDFLWYTGASNLLLTQGTWRLNKEPDNPTPWIDIEWHRNLQDNTTDIKYTNAIPGGSENGGYIFFRTTTDVIYNRFFDVYNKGQDNLTNIEWHRTTKKGHVKDSNHFGDDDWHCWDQSLNNGTCP